jgi:hypothetical protein
MNYNRSLITAAVAALTLMAGAAHAQLGLDFTGGSNASAVPNQTLGWKFTLSQAKTVTHLGLFDLGGNGFVDGRHLVGLWSLTGTALGQVTVTSASAGEASASGAGLWRFEALGSSLNLAAGTYVIGADYRTGNDQVRINTASPMTAPGLTYNGWRFVSNGNVTSGFDFPDADFPNIGVFGPNLKFGQGPSNLTPEMPAAVQVIPVLLAVGGMLLYKRRKAAQS